MPDILDRFLRYVKINTQSDESVSDRTPSTENQWQLARLLEEELNQLGLQDVLLNDKCFLTATLPANVNQDLPVIGFLAHMDTSPDFNGEGVNPQIIERYDGSDIPLKGKEGLVLSPREFLALLDYRGQTIITTDGTTLLGADDKAGIAIIMEVLACLKARPDISHGMIRVAFTPDEETGYGITHFDVGAFGADFAYTLDGGVLGELAYETFNAARAYVDMRGKSVHTGDAKGVMVNAMQAFFEYNALLPVQQRPEYTEGREGFYHLWRMSAGTVESVQGVYLLREHDSVKFEKQKEIMQACAQFINRKYGEGTVTVRLEEEYRNMREALEPVMHIVDTARQAIRELGIEPITRPIRGGTDGARLSFMGLPSPDLFTGGHNFHGPYEFIPLESMQKAAQVVLKIIELYSR